MAYDEDLANRLRELIGPEPALSERRMFGGLAFLVHGNMAVAASSKGGILVRVDPAESERLLAGAAVTQMVMGGKPTRGWLRVDTDGMRRATLQRWVDRGIGYARSLPPKTS